MNVHEVLNSVKTHAAGNADTKKDMNEIKKAFADMLHDKKEMAENQKENMTLDDESKELLSSQKKVANYWEIRIKKHKEMMEEIAELTERKQLKEKIWSDWEREKKLMENRINFEESLKKPLEKDSPYQDTVSHHYITGIPASVLMAIL